MSISGKRLWTFIVHGGETVTLQPKGNIPELHEGGMSVLKFVLTDDHAEETKTILEQHGCSVKMTTERQTEEQADERSRLAGAFRDTSVFPCERCPECAWFDPTHADNYCGAQTWPPESLHALLQRLPKAREDLNLCPLERGKEIL